jgi:hypothetical protein
VVCQLAQGQRADYSVLRRVQFGESMRVPVERLRDLLDRQLSLIDAFQRRVVASPTVLP